MPTPLSPSSSQEIVAISPPPSDRPLKRRRPDPTSTTIPLPDPVKFAPELRDRIAQRVREQEIQAERQSGKRKARGEEVLRERRDMQGKSRSQVIERMLNTRGKEVNPITNSDLYSRTDHFVSAATGHQQSNRGGGSAGAATYWEARSAKIEDQAREKKTDILKGCVFYINGSTGPKLSNLQLQHMITSNGGRFTPTQNSSNTHIIANGGLSGSKTQKWINGQGSRGGAKRVKVIRVDWVIDSVEKGRRLSEVGYGMVEDPSSLLTAFAVKPKAERNEL